MFEIILDGPGKNALGSEMMTSLVAKLQEAAGRPVLFTGAGDAFSAGLDLKEVASLDRDAMREFLRLLDSCVTALFSYPAPTVALVNGHAIAGGCVLAMCCDRRVCVTNPRTRIGLNEVALGVRFPPRTFAAMRLRVPHRHAEEVFLGSKLHDPVRALALGLVDELSDDAPRVARERLAELAERPSEAYALAKRDLRGTALDLASDDTLERWLDESVPLWTSDAVKEKLAAALAR